MNAQGLECKLGKKKSRADEGVAICFRRSKFVCEETELRVFRESLMNEPEHEALRQDLRRRWGRVLDVVITKMPAVVLLQCLRRTDDSDRAVIVANSHFYWHPKCGHIRALQAYIMMCNLAKFSAEMRRRYDHVDVVIAGDFNADAGTGAIDLFTKGRIPSDHPTWAFAPIFGLGNYETAPSNPEIPPEQSTPLAETSQGSAAAPERALETAQPLLEVPDAAMTPQEISPLGPELTVPSNVKLQSALAEVEKTYKFTNHIGVFKAILDWIFISPNLKVCACLSFFMQSSVNSQLCAFTTVCIHKCMQSQLCAFSTVFMQELGLCLALHARMHVFFFVRSSKVYAACHWRRFGMRVE